MILKLDYSGSGAPLNNMHANYDNDFSLFAPKTSPLSDYFRFTFVRNPYARVLSFYTDRILNDPNERFIAHEAPQYRRFFKAGMDFEDFAQRLSELPLEDLEQHLAPQTFFLFSHKRLVVDYIGRLETIDRDFRVIKAYVNSDIEMLHIRKTKQPEHAGLYSEASAACIHDKYKIDFDFLGYQTDSWKQI